ncbi:MAG: glycine-rich domain-containing protein [Bacteroidia bacterium]
MKKLFLILLITGYHFLNAQCGTVCSTVTASGSWTCPPGVTSVTVQCWGGGGAGGGVSASSAVSAGGGGAGGSFAQGTVAVTAGSSYNIVVGAGGAGVSGAAGGAGGTSSFNGTSVVAVGGNGGGLGTNGNGTAATGSSAGNTGTTVFAGGNGSAGVNTSAHGGGGGGGAGSTAAGGNSTSTTGGTGGAGGGGTGGSGETTANTCGTAASAPGGGGGGAYTNVVSTYAGCSGASGQVVICYSQATCSGTPTAGTATASVTDNCVSYSSVLSLSGNSACGVTYQWQSSADNSTWSNIAGATTSPYTVTLSSNTYYHCVVTCTSGGASAASSSVYATLTPSLCTCYDGIQNQGETAIDCGGPCMACTVNSGTLASTCACSSTAATYSIFPTQCPQIGTSAYDLNSPNVQFTSCGSPTVPSPSVTCGGGAGGNTGCWVHLDLAGSNSAQLQYISGGSASGNNACWAAAFQGTGCGALTAVTNSCQQSVAFNPPGHAAYNVEWSGLDPSQDLWIYVFNDGNKGFTLQYQVVGTSTTTAPSNTTCASNSTATGNACNLGATGASFTPPTAGGQTCSGGTWSSNENTTFYSFTPTASTASLSINNIICNDGTSGNAQFAVWTSCAAIGTYTSTSTYLGCAVGTGTISLTGLTAGNTYYIASDGFAGDNCKWDFAGTNIVILPIELLNLKATSRNNEIDLRWTTATETNNRFFTIERSKDAMNFEYVTTVPGAGNSNTTIRYNTTDKRPYDGISYYRLKQTDYDGESTYSYIVSVENKPVGAIGDIQVIYDAPESITFKATCDEGDEINYSVVDVNGKELASGEFICTKGANQVQLPIENYTKGIYFVKFYSKASVKQAKFIKY